MSILRKVIVIVLTLVLLSVVKRLLNRYSPTSIIFHYNFLTCIQYFLLIGVLIWALLQALFHVAWKKKLKAKTFWIVFLGLLVCSEAFFYYLIRHSERAGDRFHSLLTEYYLTYEINFPRLSYDSTLSYTLRKNDVYDHDNIEFSNEIGVNSMGLRDDSASLVKPNVICLGDSYTMGWGVTSDEAFPKLIASKTGLKVLNAGINSYGTVRELLLLNRLDTSNLKYLVIQYCYNDFEENRAFLRNRHYLPVGSQETQDRTFKSYQFARMYFPFKYTLTILRMCVRNLLSKEAREVERWQGGRSIYGLYTGRGGRISLHFR